MKRDLELEKKILKYGRIMRQESEKRPDAKILRRFKDAERLWNSAVDELRGRMEVKAEIVKKIEFRKRLHGYMADDKCLTCVEYDNLINLLTKGIAQFPSKHWEIVKEKDFKKMNKFLSGGRNGKK